MMANQLARIAVAAGVALAGVNLVGPDPGDLVLVCVAPLVLLLRPGAALLPRADLLIRLVLAVFLGGYLLSLALNEFKSSFVLNFGLNVVFFILVYVVATSRDGVPFGLEKPLVVGFLASVVVAAVAGTGDVSLPSPFFDVSRDNRFMGLLGDPNLLGLLATFVTLVTIERIVLSGRSVARRLALLGILVGAFTVLVATQSRSAWVAMAASLLGYVFLLLRSSRRAVGRLLPLLASATVLVAVLATAWSTGLFEDARRTELEGEAESQAEEERFQFLYTFASLAIGAQRPVGVGPGMTADFTGFTNRDGDPIGGHNAFVQVFTENGVLAVCALFALIVITSLRLYRQAVNGEFFLGVSCRVLLCGCVSTAIVGMAHDLLAWRVAWIMLTLGILSAAMLPQSHRHHVRARLAVRVQ